MIAVIDYGLGNVRSVAGAVQRVGYEPVLTRDPHTLARADKLILPGVGAFPDGMARLKAQGLDGVLGELVIGRGKPILGICLGMQLLAKESLEFGRHQGLGWIDATVIKLECDGTKLRLPHVGWNDLFQVARCPLFKEIPEDALFYYVHSYHLECRSRDLVKGECEYGGRVTAVVQKDNIFGVQFHPEKSQLCGLVMLKNFLDL